MLTDEDVAKIKDVVFDVIQDVVMPAFEAVTTKRELNDVEQRLGQRLHSLETRMEQIDRKLDIFSDKVQVQGHTLTDHEQRITSLEQARAAA